MSIIDELIYDRTQADVDKVFALKNKILTSGLSALTDEERAEYMAGMKGAYNAGDLNRVGQAVEYVAAKMHTLPVELAAYRAQYHVASDENFNVPYDPESVVVAPKTDWTVNDTPTSAQAKNYLLDLSILRKQLDLPKNTPTVPGTLDKLSFELANDMERLLYIIYRTLLGVEAEIYEKIDRTAPAFSYAGITWSGE